MIFSCSIYVLFVLNAHGRAVPTEERLRRRLNTESFANTLSEVAPLLPINGADEQLYDHAEHDEVVFLDPQCARNASYADILRQRLIDEEKDCLIENPFSPHALSTDDYFYFYLKWNTDNAENCAAGVIIDFEAYCISKIEYEPIFALRRQLRGGNFNNDNETEEESGNELSDAPTSAPRSRSRTIDEPSAAPASSPIRSRIRAPSVSPSKAPSASLSTNSSMSEPISTSTPKQESLIVSSQPSSQAPSASPSLLPTMEPTTMEPSTSPTMELSIDPTQSPTTEPTLIPTASPTTSAPSHPGELVCGDHISGEYNGGVLQVEVRMPFQGAMVLDFTASTFVIDRVNLTTYNGRNGDFVKLYEDADLRDADGQDIFTVSDLQRNRDCVFKIVGVDGIKTGTFDLSIGCVSDAPTSSPSVEPTRMPTRAPSTEPTPIPSANPTTTPTDSPSTEPTSEPTRDPSASPSTEPTMAPTKIPTGEPSTSPTMGPSMDPTQSPTTEPTTVPTAIPSREPSGLPSAQPSSTPTTPAPTNPGELSCGSRKSGQYRGQTLQIEVRMPFDGDMTVDASESDFEIKPIVAVDMSNDTAVNSKGRKGKLTVKDLTRNTDLQFDIDGVDGVETGTYVIEIDCTSDAPTRSPTVEPSIGDCKPLVHVDWNVMNGALRECEGDCDGDYDCADGLRCWHQEDNEGNQAPKGCSGRPDMLADYEDFCYDPRSAPCLTQSTTTEPTSMSGLVPTAEPTTSDCKPLVHVDWDQTTYPDLQECEGDCDNDMDCDDGLVCWRYDYYINEGDLPPKRCSGVPFNVAGIKMDFCYDPRSGPCIPTPSPTPSPSTEPTTSSPTAPSSSPTTSSPTAPTTEPTIPDCKPLVHVRWDGKGLQACEGDCDLDIDCAGELVCWEQKRESDVRPPGCSGMPNMVDEYEGFCYDPRSGPCLTHSPTPQPTNTVGSLPTAEPSIGDCKPLVHVDWDAKNLQECEGDCDGDYDCAEGLVCWEQEAYRGNQPPKGCSGRPDFEVYTEDFCYDPNRGPCLTQSPTSTSTRVPTSNLDCGQFPIDEHLEQCSAIFPETVQNVAALIANLSATLDTVVNADLPTIFAVIEQSLSVDVFHLKRLVRAIQNASIPDIEARLSALEMSGRKPRKNQRDMSPSGPSTSVFAQYSDTLLMVLMTSNLALLAYVARGCAGYGDRKDKHRYAKIGYMSDDSDTQTLANEEEDQQELL